MRGRRFEARGMPLGSFYDDSPREPRKYPPYQCFSTASGWTEIVSEGHAPMQASWPSDRGTPTTYSANASPAFRALAEDVRSRN